MSTTRDPARLDTAMVAARDAVDTETRAMDGLWARNETALRLAIRTLGGIRGRVIVSGLGKSGHIGAKISASMASMGFPSLFLHSAEALHGDFGMCTPDDGGLLISNSGTTAEVVQVARLMKHIGMPIFSMTRDDQSPLAQLCLANLDIGVPREADPLDLAPTASTLVTLALGDALSVGLQGLMDFNENDFALRHPGGALGQRLLGAEVVGNV